MKPLASAAYRRACAFATAVVALVAARLRCVDEDDEDDEEEVGEYVSDPSALDAELRRRVMRSRREWEADALCVPLRVWEGFSV